MDKLLALDRATCRQEFEARFTDRRMSADYLKLYEKAVAEKTRKSELLSTAA